MRIFLLFLMVLFPVLSPQSVFARSEKIVAVVSDDVISMSDLNDRLKLIAVSSGLPQTPEIYKKLSGQVMGTLIDEQIMLQEARRLEIQILPEEIDSGFVSVAQQNSFTADQFREILQNGGISINTMKRQIESQIAWSKIVQRTIRPRISISDSDVDNVLNRMMSNRGSTEYHVAEIFLPVDAAENEADIRQLSQKLRQRIQTDPSSFPKLAQQFSKSAGATQGGDIGWVQEDQLPGELSKVLKVMEKGQVSAPVRSLRGYHIVLLRNIRQISDETMPTREQVNNSLGAQRLERMQRRYLLDLRATAFIESRI